MLSPADAEVAGRDAAVPGMALVLDPEAIAARLRATPSWEGLRSARATYVRYKPATSCLVGYELELPGGAVPAVAKAYRMGDRPKLAKARKHAPPGQVVSLDAELVVVVGAAGDRDLPLPGRLARTDARRRLLRILLPGEPEVWDGVPRCLRYKPERRWVGVVPHQGRPVALLKGYRPGDLAQARAGLRFAAATTLTTPRLLGASTRAGTLASSWLAGRILADALDEPGTIATVGQVGVTLAQLHGQRPGLLAPVTRADDAHAVRAAAAAVATVAPHLGDRAGRLAATFARRLIGGPALCGPRHGDFSPDQVVVGDRGVGIVDFDRSAIGDPIADLGQFVAALHVAELDGSLGRERCSSLTDELLAGYAAAGARCDEDRRRDHTGAALVRLAVEPFRYRMASWPQRTEALLDRAMDLSGDAVAR